MRKREKKKEKNLPRKGNKKGDVFILEHPLFTLYSEKKREIRGGGDCQPINLRAEGEGKVCIFHNPMGGEALHFITMTKVQNEGGGAFSLHCREGGEEKITYAKCLQKETNHGIDIRKMEKRKEGRNSQLQ